MTSGRIEIYGKYSTVDLLAGMPEEAFEALQDARAQNQKPRIQKARGPAFTPGKPGKGSPRRDD